MQARKVIIVSEKTNSVKRLTEFTGETFQDLKNHPEARSLFTGDVEAVVNVTKCTLKRDDATLPEGDFKVYLVVTKNTSGVITPAEATTLGQEIATAIVKASALGGTDEKKELMNEIKSAIRNFYNLEEEEEEAEEGTTATTGNPADSEDAEVLRELRELTNG